MIRAEGRLQARRELGGFGSSSRLTYVDLEPAGYVIGVDDRPLDRADDARIAAALALFEQMQDGSVFDHSPRQAEQGNLSVMNRLSIHPHFPAAADEGSPEFAQLNQKLDIEADIAGNIRMLYPMANSPRAGEACVLGGGIGHKHLIERRGGLSPDCDNSPRP